MIRQATIDDIQALLAIEQASFRGDRLSRRSFRHLLTRGRALLLLEESGTRLRGYILLLFRAGTSVGRIYSIATHPQELGRGVAATLLLAAELGARARRCRALRLEIRHDNAPSLRLFQGRGYRVFGEYADYYEDGMAAFRLQKQLTPPDAPPLPVGCSSPMRRREAGL